MDNSDKVPYNKLLLDAAGPGLTNSPGLELAKTPTGIDGLDQITGGGLPMGRVTLVSGTAGAGKTLLGLCG
jgi:predicted ATP-dependent serine protease